jgi:hypothetical protein
LILLLLIPLLFYALTTLSKPVLQEGFVCDEDEGMGISGRDADWGENEIPKQWPFMNGHCFG